MTELWKKLKAVWSEFGLAKTGVYASSISYFFFLSIVPLLIISVSLVSLVGLSESDVSLFFRSILPEAFGDFVSMLVREAFEKSGLAISVSSLMLIWSASKGVTALRGGLNSVFGIEETEIKPVIIARSVLAVIIIGALLAAVMYLVFGNSVLHAIASFVPGIKDSSHSQFLLNTVVTILFGVFALALCYTYLPAGKRRFTSQIPGAACAVVACGLLSFGFRIYVENVSNFTVLYGSIATAALFLFWMYLLFYVLLACAFVSRYVAEKATQN